MTQIDGDHLLELIEEAEAARVIDEVQGQRHVIGRYSFSHALIRETLYGELSTTRRARLHKQIGETLEALYAADIDAHLSELAYHFGEAAAAGDVEKAIDYAQRAGARAVELYAWEEAAAHYGGALQTLELLPALDERRQVELLLALGDALSGAGDREGFREAFAGAAGVARRIGDSATFARAALGFASPLSLGSQNIGLLEEALDLLVTGDSALRAMVTARLAQELYDVGGQRERMTALEQEALAMARRVGDKAALMYTLGRIIWSVGAADSRSGQLTDLIDEAIRLAQETGNKRATSEACMSRVFVSLTLGERDAADAAIDVYERLIGEMRTHGFVSHLRAMQARLDGRLDTVEALAQQGVVDRQRADPQGALQEFGAQMLDLRRAQGRVGEMEPVFKGLADQFPLTPALRVALALVYEEEDRFEETRAVFDELAKDDFAAFPDDFTRPISLVLLADMCCYLDDQPRAAALYEMLLPLANQCIVVGWAIACLGSASAPLGVLATTLGRFDDAERHFEDAIAMNRKMRAPTWVAEAQLGHARMLLRRDSPGDRERALEFLQLALDAGQRMGMKKLVEDGLALKARAADTERGSV